MNQEIIQQLNKLKLIKPDPVFAARSRILIFKSASKTSPVFLPRLVWFAAPAVIILAVIISNFGGPKQTLTSLNNSEKLDQEFNNLAINIQIQKITYQQNINQTIASALTEISDTQTKHLNRSVLEREDNSFSLPEDKNAEINDLLNKIIF